MQHQVTVYMRDLMHHDLLLFQQVRHCLGLVFLLSSWLRHCLCLVFLLSS